MSYASRTIRIAFFAAILVLLLAAVLLFAGVRNLMTSYDWVKHTWEVEYKVLRLYAGMRNSESSVRAYVLTNDTTYLSEVHNYKAELSQLLPNLHSLIDDNPKQVVNMRRMDDLIRHRLRIMDTTAALHRSGVPPALLKEQLAKGQAYTRTIAALVEVMKKEEDDLLRQREATVDSYFRRVSVFLVALTMVMLLLLVLIFNYLQKQLRLQQGMQQKLQESNTRLQEQAVALKKSNEELESFNYIASHDLKEPVRKIRTFANMIYNQDYDQLSEKGQYSLNRLTTSAERMQLLLDDLLVYTRLDHGTSERKPVDLGQIVAQTIENMQELIAETGTQIVYTALPTVTGIPFQLQQLMENLIQNAIKYHRPGVAPRIEIAGFTAPANLPEQLAQRPHRYYLVQVTDNGLGFPQKYADKVFELFSRLHHSKEQTGSGIGLTICKKVVANHDGLITVDSSVNEGTTFRIYLPA